MFIIGRFSTVKMSSLSRWIYRFKIICIEVPAKFFFVGVDKIILKF